MEYKRSKHFKYLILYHIILVCKYRHPLLIILGDAIKLILYDISNELGFDIEVMEVDKNHIHLLVQTKSDISPK